MLNIKIIDNTNSKHLELYTVLGEYDNTEFPLSYCLLSTVAATEISKRTKALTAWVTTLCNKYGVIPQFVHVDKDMAEIRSCRKTWPQAKIQLCWWHLQKAVRTHLQLAKLSTTPYNVECTQGEYGFISAGFQPSGKADAKECEGCVPGKSNISFDLENMPITHIPMTQGPNSLFIQLPNLNPSQSWPPLTDYQYKSYDGRWK